MASAAMAGLASLLVQRLVVRHEITADSAAAASAAALAPCNSSNRKMNTSPAAIECFDLGIRSGNNPTSAEINAIVSTWPSWGSGSMATLKLAEASANPPASVTAHQ